MIEEAYKHIRIRTLLVWLVGVLFLYFFLGEVISGFDEVTVSNILGIIFYLLIFAWFVWQKKRQKTTFKQLLGLRNRRILQGSDIVKIGAIVFMSMVATIFTITIIGFFFPEFYELINEVEELQSFYTQADTAYPVLNTILSFITLVIAAPVVEEFIFRGVMVNRFAYKWNLKKAIFISSFLFGLAHIEPLGSFIFGILMALLYIKTGSLFVPMIVHALNNLFVVIFSLPIFTSDAEVVLPTTEEQLIVIFISGGLMLGILPILIKLWKDALSFSNS